jgi:predicted DNA-binding ribbon-helix-helix protein
MPPPKARRGKSLLRKRAIRLENHKTSVTIEKAFWTAFKEIAAARRTTISRLIATIDKDRRECQCKNLSSAIRLFVLDHYRQQNERGPGP